jgi:hypothetical protein
MDAQIYLVNFKKASLILLMPLDICSGKVIYIPKHVGYYINLKIVYV